MLNYELLMAKDYAETRLKEMIESYTKISELYANTVEGESIYGVSDELLKSLYDFLDNCGFFDNFISSVNEEPDSAIKQIHTYLSDSSNAQINARKDDILLQKQELIEQFKPENQTSNSEILANIIQMSNFVIRLVSSNKKWFGEIFQKEELSYSHLIKINKKLRAACMNEILNCKKEGENISIEHRDKLADSSGSFLFYIHDKQYFEPFFCPDNGVKIGTLDKSQYTTLGYVKVKRDGEVCPLYLSMPFKVSESKKKILRYIIDNMGDKDLSGTIAVSKTVWFAGQENICQKHEKENTANIKTRTEPLTEGELIQQKNKAFWKLIYKEISGEEIYNSLFNILTWRTSYEVQETYKRIKNDMIFALEAHGIPQDKMDVETYKLFLYLKLVTPMSQINAKQFSESKVAEMINKAASEYDIAIDFIINNEKIRNEGLRRKDLGEILSYQIKERKSKKMENENLNHAEKEEFSEPSELEKTKEPSELEKTKEPSELEKTKKPSELEKTKKPYEIEKTKKISELEETEEISEAEKIEEFSEVSKLEETEEPSESFEHKEPEEVIVHSEEESRRNSEEDDKEYILKLVEKIRTLNENIKKLNAEIDETTMSLKVAELVLIQAREALANAQNEFDEQQNNLKNQNNKLKDLQNLLDKAMEELLL